MFDSICHALGICPCCNHKLVAILQAIPIIFVWCGSYLCFWKIFKKPVDKDDK